MHASCLKLIDKKVKVIFHIIEAIYIFTTVYYKLYFYFLSQKFQLTFQHCRKLNSNQDHQNRH
jgi:hypothetical protein